MSPIVLSQAALDVVRFNDRRPLRATSDVTQIIMHTQVDAPGPHGSLTGWWNRVGFATSLSLNFRGQTWQYYDDLRRKPGGTQTADARAITCETEDDGDPEANPWNDVQLECMVKMMDELCRTFPIERRAIPEDKSKGLEDPRRWAAPGIGDHTLPHWAGPPTEKTQWIQLPRSSRWTSARGKTCVGTTRARQLYDDVIPEVIRLGDGAPPPPPKQELPNLAGMALLRQLVLESPPMSGTDVEILRGHLRGRPPKVVDDNLVYSEWFIDTYVLPFQKAHGLVVDGIVGPKTWTAVLLAG